MICDNNQYQLILGLVLLGMHYYDKESDENFSMKLSEDNYEEVSVSEKDMSSSYLKGSPLIRVKKHKPLISYEDNEWLIKLIQLNPFKMNQIIEWIQTLINFMNRQPIKSNQHIASLNFDLIRPAEQIYFIFIQEINESFVLFKIKDASGYVVSFKIQENSQKQSYLQDILKKIRRKVRVFVFDQSDETNYINDVLAKCHSTNIVVIIKQPQQLIGKANWKWVVQKIQFNGTGIRIYYSLLKKISNICQIIEDALKLETQNQKLTADLLNVYNLGPFKTDESNCLIININEAFQGALSKQKLFEVLNRGLSGLIAHVKKWEESSNNHFPGPSQGKKGICHYCKRKKSEVICRGCSNIYESTINLCIGACFHKFHEQHSTFMKKQAAQVCKHIMYFDKKCKQIGGVMDSLIEQKNTDYLTFINYLQVKMINALNRLISTQNAIDEDEVQTND